MAAHATATRYDDGYRVARFLDGLGKTLKAIGAVIAALIGLLWTTGAMVAASRPFGEIGFSMAGARPFVFIIAGVVLAVFWIVGSLVSARGQSLMAMLDAAVYVSPFLSNDERLAAMHLASPSAAVKATVPLAAKVKAAPPTVCLSCRAPVANESSRFCVQCGASLDATREVAS